MNVCHLFFPAAGDCYCALCEEDHVNAHSPITLMQSYLYSVFIITAHWCSTFFLFFNQYAWHEVILSFSFHPQAKKKCFDSKSLLRTSIVYERGGWGWHSSGAFHRSVSSYSSRYHPLELSPRPLLNSHLHKSISRCKLQIFFHPLVGCSFQTFHGSLRWVINSTASRQLEN